MRTELDSASYALGQLYAENLALYPIQRVNMYLLAEGFQDVINQNETAFESSVANEIVSGYLRELSQKEGEKYLQEAREFLDENAEREEVKTTESGMQYEVLESGSGPSPDQTDTVVVHYTGTLLDGTVFDSSVERGTPAEFPLNSVIRGWTEALQMMNVGSRWKIYLPPHLGYGDRPVPGTDIKPNMALIFEIELLDIK